MSQNQATNYSNIQFDVVVYSDLFENYSVNCTYITEEGLNNFFKVEDYSAINMTHINARSLKKNFDKILSLISNISGTLTAIAISETWLTESLQDVFFIPGYDFISKQRTEKIGGGVGIYVTHLFIILFVMIFVACLTTLNVYLLKLFRIMIQILSLDVYTGPPVMIIFVLKHLTLILVKY